MSTAGKTAIVPRENLDFGLDGDIPRHWLGGDPFKTRFFDALSVTFPEGERFFISCVRDYREQVSDVSLQEEIRAFMRQEAQHGRVHTLYNNRLKAHGIDVDWLERMQRETQDRIRRHRSRKMTIATTAAFEHLTAIMCHGFVERKDLVADFDPRMRAMYAWHAMEEVEHKAVAFDVMQKVANVGYLRRTGAMLMISFFYLIRTFSLMHYMLRKDGYGFWRQTLLWPAGLWWLYKPKRGLWTGVMGHYLQYFRPGFHPWDEGQLHSYQVWLEVFNRTDDPLEAADGVYASLKA